MLNQIIIEPLYEKVKKQLLVYIDMEKPAVLPREKELIGRFGVSRNTVRRAIQDLCSAGILKTKQGYGTVVLKYAEDKIADIGVICTDSLDIAEPWISIMLKNLRQVAHAEGYHLNLFFCHDYSINSSNNSAYSYLVNSGKLSGLILISSLQYADIAHIKNIGLPVITLDFKYLDFDFPSFVPDCMPSIATFIDNYVANGIKQFGIISKNTKVLLDTGCRGMNELIIENWAAVLQQKKLSVIPYDFSRDIATQVRAMYQLPEVQRPEVIFTPFITYGQEVEQILAEIKDWHPINITSEIKGYETGTPAIIIDPAAHAHQAMNLLHQMITAQQTVKRIRQPAPVYKRQYAALAVG